MLQPHNIILQHFHRKKPPLIYSSSQQIAVTVTFTGLKKCNRDWLQQDNPCEPKKMRLVHMRNDAGRRGPRTIGCHFECGFLPRLLPQFMSVPSNPSTTPGKYVQTTVSDTVLLLLFDTRASQQSGLSHELTEIQWRIRFAGDDCHETL